MDILNQIVEVLNKEEIRFYKLFAHRQQGNSERKDLYLLDALRKNPDASDEKSFGNCIPTEIKMPTTDYEIDYLKTSTDL